MASDSRQSINLKGKDQHGKDINIETVNSDNVTKTFLLKGHPIGISSFGQDLLGGVPMASHIKRFSDELLKKSDSIEIVTKKFHDFIKKEFGSVDTGFHICGYKKQGRISMPYVFFSHIKQDIIERRNIKSDGTLLYGATWSGQADILSGLLNPVVIKKNGKAEVIRPSTPIPWDAMTLQDAIDFSIFAIRTTIDTMRFQARPKNVGGTIEILALTPDSLKWIQKIQLKGQGDGN